MNRMTHNDLGILSYDSLIYLCTHICTYIGH